MALPVESSLRRAKQSNWRDWTPLVGGRDESSHERTKLRTSDEVWSTVKGSSDHLVGGKVKIQTGIVCGERRCNNGTGGARKRIVSWAVFQCVLSHHASMKSLQVDNA